MSVITVSIDAARPLALLRNGGKRLAYAIVNAMTATAKEVQKAERARVRQEFTVRKNDFIMRQAAVIKGENGGSGFASVRKSRFETRIAVGQKPRLFLSGFESGEERKPVRGRNVAVPVTGGPARPSFASSVQDQLTFKAMALRRTSPGRRRRRSGARSRGLQWKGSNRTFQLDQTAKSPMGAIFQRVGPKRGDIRIAYTFARPPHLDRRLRFVQTGQQVAMAFWPGALKRQVEEALYYNLFGVKR